MPSVTCRRSQLSSRVVASLVAAAFVQSFAACGGIVVVQVPFADDAGGDTRDAAVDTGSVRTDTGRVSEASPTDAVQPPDSTVTCGQYQNTTIGSYIVETDYWNLATCPGTQCMTINDVTGAFSVTQGPNCGNTVASYPNVLYGSAFGAASPGSALPMQVSALTSVTSSWEFSVGGVSTDQYDVAYDIWFCPNHACGASGFNGGTELMIWLNYQNATGWETDLGSVNLGGYNWEVWTFAQGGGGNSWTYLSYMIQPSMVTSVTNLDLLAFFQDAQARGFVQSSWYLYAVQAGDELRTGGLPFTVNSFSVSVN